MRYDVSVIGLFILDILGRPEAPEATGFQRPRFDLAAVRVVAEQRGIPKRRPVPSTQ